MTTEDQLSHAERIRLESLNQANTYAVRHPNLGADDVVKVAVKFEAFIKDLDSCGSPAK